MLIRGLSVSIVDLGAHLVGTDSERAHDEVALTGLQAGISAGAVVGALGATLALAAGVLAAIGITTAIGAPDPLSRPPACS